METLRRRHGSSSDEDAYGGGGGGDGRGEDRFRKSLSPGIRRRRADESISNSSDEELRSNQLQTFHIQPFNRSCGGWSREVARNMYKVLQERNPHFANERGLRWLLDEIERNDQLTQAELVERMTEAAAEIGEGGPVAAGASETVNTLEDEEQFVDELHEALEKSGSKQRKKLIKSSLNKLDSFVEYLLAKINAQWLTLAYAVFPFHQVQTLVLICLVQFISLASIIQILPCTIAYLAFFFMVYFTLRMFQNKSVMRERRTWKRLLDVFEKEDDTRSLSEEDRRARESFFLTDNWDPYLNFTLALIVFVLAVGAAGKYLPYCALLAGVATLFAGATFVSLADAQDQYALLAMSANIISCLPVIFERLHFSIGKWRIWKSIVEFRVTYLIFSISVPSIALMAIPTIYILMALNKKTWKEAAQTIVPHIITVIWSDVALSLILIGWKSFEWMDVILTVACVSLFLFPTAAAGVLVAGVVIAQLKAKIAWLSIIKSMITLFVLVSPFLGAKIYGYLKSIYKVQVFPDDAKKRKWVLFMVYLCALLMVISFMYQGQSTFDPSVDTTNMTWSQYDKHCSPTSTNIIKNQIECSQLKGTAISWKGTVQTVRIVQIDNSFETLLAYLPESLGQTLRCFYDTDTTHISHPTGMKPNQCSLTHHNIYTFEIEVSGPYGERVISSNKGQILLSASHVFFEQISLIDEGDVVKFVGFFDQYPVFRYPPKLKLLQLECVMCKQFQKNHNAHLRVTSSKLDRTGIWQRIFNAFRFFFNFIFAPAVRIK